MYDINELIAENPSGMKLLSAWGINDGGAIAGQGLVNGQRHAFVAIPLSYPLTFLRAVGDVHDRGKPVVGHDGSQ